MIRLCSIVWILRISSRFWPLSLRELSSSRSGSHLRQTSGIKQHLWSRKITDNWRPSYLEYIWKHCVLCQRSSKTALRGVSETPYDLDAWVRSTYSLITVSKFTAAATKWASQAAELKILREVVTADRKRMEEKLTTDDNVANVLKWIKKEDDSEPSLMEVRAKVTSDGRYDQAAQWFVQSQGFQDWVSPLHHEDSQESKRVLWLRGAYGTGKTTILSVFSPRTLSVLTSTQWPNYTLAGVSQT